MSIRAFDVNADTKHIIRQGVCKYKLHTPSMMKCLYLYSSIGLIVIWSIGEWQRRKWVEGEWAHAIPTFTHAKFTFEQIYYLNKCTHLKFTFEQIYSVLTLSEILTDNIYFYTHKSDVVFMFYAFWHLHVVVSDFCVDLMKINS